MFDWNDDGKLDSFEQAKKNDSVSVDEAFNQLNSQICNG